MNFSANQRKDVPIMENCQSVIIKSHPQDANMTIADSGLTGACNEESKVQLEAMIKAALPLDSRTLFIATLPFSIIYIVTEAITYVFEKLNPKNWPIFKAKKKNNSRTYLP